MAKAARSIVLEVPPSTALDGCRRAVASLEWELVSADEYRVTAGQDSARLCCRSAPVTVEVELIGAAEGTTALALLGRVPGFGPIASRDLRSALVLYEDAVRRCIAPARG